MRISYDAGQLFQCKNFVPLHLECDMTTVRRKIHAFCGVFTNCIIYHSVKVKLTLNTLSVMSHERS